MRQDHPSAMKAIVMLSVAIVAQAGLSAGESVLLSDSLYGASFEDYAEGDTLDSGKGTSAGTWGWPAIPSGVSAIAERKQDDGDSGSSTMFMSCCTTSASATNSSGIAFTPTNGCLRARQSVEMSVRVGAYASPPNFPDGARTGFAVCAPVGESKYFVGWAGAQKCWTNLYLQSGVELPSAQWYEVRTKFLKRDDGRLFVQYWIKVGDAYYVFRTKETQDGAAWLDLGTVGEGPLVRKVEFRGDGGLEYLEGFKPAQGLYVGVGRWYEIKSYDDATDNNYDTGEWLNGNRPAIDKGSNAYVIDVGEGETPNEYMPKKRRAASEAIEASVRFTSTSRDETVPDGACASVRIVADPDVQDTQPDPLYRFACLVNGQWKTNDTVLASFEKDYVIQVLLDSDAGTITYRAKEGIGYDGGEYMTLASGKLPTAEFGFSDVYFEGSGLVYKIKSTDRSTNE